MQKIKKDDLVVVIAGKDKDKQGKVLSVDVKKNKVLVQGCNMVTKHTKQSPANPQGGIVNQEAPIDISNVMLVVDGKATRVGFEVRDGKKVRVAKKTGKVSLAPMSGYERRIIHIALRDNLEVTTHSEGDDPYRRVVVTAINS